MACKVLNTKLSAIYDTILALTRENPDTIKSPKDIFDWFQTNRPEITDQEIIDSLIATTPKKVETAKNNMTKARNDIKRQAKILDVLTDIAGALNVKTKGEFAPEGKMNEVLDLTNELYKLVGGRGKHMSSLDLTDALIRIGDVQILYSKFFDKSESSSLLSKEQLDNSLKDLKNKLQVDKLNIREKALEEKIKALSDPDSIDASAMADEDAEVGEVVPTSIEILEKESRLAELKTAYNKKLADVAIKARAKKYGLMGFKSPEQVKTAESILKGASEAWDFMKILRFMFDASAALVQLAPITIGDAASLDLKSLVKGDFRTAFAGQRRVAESFKNNVIAITVDNLRAAKAARDRGDPDAFKKSMGKLTLKYEQQLRTHPYYSLAIKSGLSLGESRSITNTEEYFSGELINKINILGIIKSISEDIMVSQLNSARMILFENFVQSNPGFSEADAKKVAGFINELSGTTKISVGAAKYLFSAPKLAMSRMSLAFVRPFTVLGNIDLKRSRDEGGLRFQTAADQYIAKEMFKMWSGFAKTAAAISLIGAMGFGVDWGGDPEESDFLRVRAGNTAYDFTGGLGAMYRAAVKSIFNAIGPGDDSSFLAKRKADFNKGVLHEDALDPWIKTLFKHRLHPTITGAKSILTGRDFFNKPFHDYFGAGALSSRLEATLRSAMPIFIETLIDQYMFTPNTKFTEDPFLQFLGGFTEDTFINFMQFLGANTFEYSNKSQSLTSEDYFNKIKSKPNTDYPDKLATKDYQADVRLEILRDKYKNEYGDMVGEIIEANPDQTKGQFQTRVKNKGLILEKKFLKENREQIKLLKKVNKK